MLGFGLIIYLSSRIGAKGIFRNIALNTNMDNESGYIAVSLELRDLVGKVGIANTDFRPSGKINIDGMAYDAISDGVFISKGSNVRVVKFELGQLYVAESE